MGVDVFEAKNDAPVGADSDGPKVLSITLELMEAIAGKIESLRGRCGVEQGKNVLDLGEKVLPDLVPLAALIEAFQASVFELTITQKLLYTDNCHLSTGSQDGLIRPPCQHRG
jgi:glutamine synthetase type III